MNDKPNCLKCRHYMNTWNKDLPRGCRLFGIKTASFPSLVVKRETGSECNAYEIRAHMAPKKELDLNDPDLW